MYAYLDGDDIGSQLEGLLRKGDLDKARQFSAAINEAFEACRDLVIAQGAHFILGG
ncbi:MAG: hypothetical protein AAFR87_20230 [Bacteroidota bacterium]